MIKYTKEQLEAIEYFDNNLLISASAGSGKTKVLIEKVLKLLKSGVKLNEILMVTFTELAGSEMKFKLEEIIFNEISNKCEGYENLLLYFNNINSADISTLHSFCQKLICKYYYVLNIEPNFNLGDEAYLNNLKNLALDLTIKEYLNNNDEEFINLSNMFMKYRDYADFKKEILEYYKFLTSKFKKEKFVENNLNCNYETNLNKNYLITKYINYLKLQLKKYVNELNELFCEAKLLYCEKLINLCETFLSLLSFNLNNNETAILSFITEIKFPVISLSKNAEFEEVILKEKLKDFSKRIKIFLKDVKDTFNILNLNDLKEDILISKKYLIKFNEVVLNFENIYNKLKIERNYYDFNDLETLTLKLLENENVLNEISNKYKYVFVDEYQDTNNIQEAILEKISKRAKRIMVGDVKQSIYSFRECNPEIFNDKFVSYSNNLNGKVVNLNKNFRSNNEILNFSNQIFSNLMKEENCNYNYLKQGMFVPNINYENNINNKLKPVEILCVNKESVGEDVNHEVLLIVNSIYNLLQQQICEDKNTRNLTYKDIAIIFRDRNGNMLSLCKYLDELKIPYNVKYKEQIYKCFEVKLILNYLSVLNCADDDIALYSVLKNIYKINENDLISVKIDGISLYGNIVNLTEKDKVFNKINKFFVDLKEFKALLNEISIKELVKLIIKKFNFESLMMAHFGKISLERLNLFTDKISNNIYSLSEFLSFCKENENSVYEVKKITEENSIYIGTIHSTKGLEYNAVILADSGRRIFKVNKNNLVYNANFGVGIKSFDLNLKKKSSNTIFSIITKLNRNEEFNEEARLLYVALTRPKNFLFIIGSEKEKELKQVNNYLDFLNLNNYLKMIFSTNLNSNNFNINILDKNDEIFNNKVIEKTIEQQNFNLNYDLYNFYNNKQYEFNNSKYLQLKNSVTSLSSEDEEIYNISNFKLTDNDKEDFIEMGNSYHLALEKLPFNLKSEIEVKNKMISLIENNIIPANIYEFVTNEKLFKANKCVSKLIDENDKVYKEKIFMLYDEHDKFTNSGVKDKILIQGIIDIFIEKEDEIILIDYKTSRLNDVNVIKKYSLQLSLYETALKEKFKNKKITKYIYSIFLDKLINVV